MSEIITLSQFGKLTGKVFAPVSLTWDMSEYVQVSKSSLMKELKYYKISRVEIIKQDDGSVLFTGGSEH